jgi:hypothetical protein
MPRVERDAAVTLVVLIYRSLKWLDWCMEGVDSSRQKTKYRWLVVSNDGTDEVRRDPRISVDWQNVNPRAFYIENVYRAWNEGVLAAPTQWVILMNSDMLGASFWIDELIEAKTFHRKSIPTSLLVESGRLPSGMPEYVQNFGMHPEEFRRQDFLQHAAGLRRSGKVEPGRLYMPVLLDRQEFEDLGRYPEGNPPGTTGDKDLFARYAAAGYEHLTALGSVVYHCQLGEQHWP